MAGRKELGEGGQCCALYMYMVHMLWVHLSLCLLASLVPLLQCLFIYIWTHYARTFLVYAWEAPSHSLHATPISLNLDNLQAQGTKWRMGPGKAMHVLIASWSFLEHSYSLTKD